MEASHLFFLCWILSYPLVTIRTHHSPLTFGKGIHEKNGHQITDVSMLVTPFWSVWILDNPLSTIQKLYFRTLAEHVLCYALKCSVAVNLIS